MEFKLTSPAFANGEVIPRKYTGEGEDVSPPLSWSQLPEGAKELAIICDDPDAPTTKPWVHWLIYGIPASQGSLPEGMPQEAKVKEMPGVMQGRNSWQSGATIGYRGPMPPPGDGPHHYYFTAYALPGKIVAEPGLDKETLLHEIENHVVGKAVLMGIYER